MKYTFTIFAALASVASAQSTCEATAEKVPACALGYLASAASSIGGCGLVDFNCQCSNSAAVQSAVQNSVIAQCSDLGAVLNGANALCSCARANPGQTISLNSIQSQCQPSAAAIPPCGLGYVAEAANTIGGCALYDFACQCSNAGAVMSSISGTISSACGASASNVFASASALCACVSGGAAGGSASGSGSAVATSTMASTGAMTTASPSGTSPSTAKMTTSAGGVGTVTMQGSMTSSGLPVFTNAAAVALPAVGALLGGLAGIVAWI